MIKYQLETLMRPRPLAGDTWAVREGPLLDLVLPDGVAGAHRGRQDADGQGGEDS